MLGFSVVVVVAALLLRWACGMFKGCLGYNGSCLAKGKNKHGHGMGRRDDQPCSMIVTPIN